MSLQTRIKAAGAAAAAAPVDAGRRRAVKRRTKRAVMDRMGYDEVARISAYIDPALARSELRPAVEAAIDCGISATDALDDLLVRIDAPGLSLVTLALKVSQRTGAPLADLLSEASSMVGERIELKRRLDVKTSQARMSAHMVAAMPAGMCAVLALLSADFRRGLATPAGAGAVVLGLALNAVALVVIRRIMRVEL